jgi:biotin carboxylase
MFTKVLVANRGEIADPHLPDAPEMGIDRRRCTRADRDAPSSPTRDEAYLIGPGPGRPELPVSETIVRTALRAGAERCIPASASWPRTPASPGLRAPAGVRGAAAGCDRGDGVEDQRGRRWSAPG